MSADDLKQCQRVQMLAPLRPPFRLGFVMCVPVAIAAVDDEVDQLVILIVPVGVVNLPTGAALAAALAYVVLAFQRLQA